MDDVKKIDPVKQLDLRPCEKYFLNFWIPKIGDRVLLENKEYQIDQILQESQAVLKDHDKIAWIQDCAWKPSLQDLDKIVVSMGGDVQNDTIMLPLRNNRRCYFTRPDTLESYESIIREIRVLQIINNKGAS